MLHSPSDLLHIKSLSTRNSAVLTKWNCLNADWNWCKQSKVFKCFSNCCEQAYSITLDKNDVLYKSRYELKLSVSLSYFSIDLTKAIFSPSGKTPDLNQKLTRSQQYSASFSICSESKVLYRMHRSDGKF